VHEGIDVDRYDELSLNRNAFYLLRARSNIRPPVQPKGGFWSRCSVTEADDQPAGEENPTAQKDLRTRGRFSGRLQLVPGPQAAKVAGVFPLSRPQVPVARKIGRKSRSWRDLSQAREICRKSSLDSV
jgi:hypothetical protein